VGIDKYPRYPAQPETTDLPLLGARGRPKIAAPELRSSLVRPANEERPARPLPFPGCVLLSAEGAIEYPPVDDRALRTLVHAVTGASPATAIDVHLADLAAALSVPTVPFRSG
jgi:hypothetical protein